MNAGLSERQVHVALAKACRMDVVAFKPGNVSLWSAGHGMAASDFLRSATVAVPCLATNDASVGARIESAVTATMAAVGCNTNLGIVLLLAPLAQAAQTPSGTGELRARVARVLRALDTDDAAACFRAICVAQPAGLGEVADGDVRRVPSMTLLEAMRLASVRDRIAQAYVSDYAEIFELGVPLLAAARQRWRSLAWATSACYLHLLAHAPDTHIERKWGKTLATAVSARARAVASALEACENPRNAVAHLRAFDDELKSRGVNPGTSADLTVACVAVFLLQSRLA
ncbi:MAG: triphosphoribosyl-dephospho-CoA synthase [Gammaproteobacteria bacterium]|nr:triphosphoribosyl-dephospho-CoA synthase [Gammaproteobacteria bacterium]